MPLFSAWNASGNPISPRNLDPKLRGAWKESRRESYIGHTLRFHRRATRPVNLDSRISRTCNASKYEDTVVAAFDRVHDLAQLVTSCFTFATAKMRDVKMWHELNIQTLLSFNSIDQENTK